MVNAVIEKTDDQIHVSITGHADFNPGNDIVCAGISAIAFLLIGTLQIYKNREENSFSFEFSQKSGEIQCKITKIYESYKNTLNTLIEAVYIGLKQIELTYFMHIKVKFTENGIPILDRES